MCSSLDQNDGNDNNDYVESQWFNNTRLITTVRMILRRKTVDVWPGHKSVPIKCFLFSSHFCRFGQPWNLAETQLRCVSDLSLDLALGVHLLRLLWRERLVPRKSAIHHAVEALRIREIFLGKPWKTAFKDDVKQIETGCKSLRTGASRVYTIYYIVSDRPRKWMSIHKLTHVAWQNSKSTKNEMLSQNWLILFFSSNWHIIGAYVPSHLDFLEAGSAFCLSEL